MRALVPLFTVVAVTAATQQAAAQNQAWLAPGAPMQLGAPRPLIPAEREYRPSTSSSSASSTTITTVLSGSSRWESNAPPATSSPSQMGSAAPAFTAPSAVVPSASTPQYKSVSPYPPIPQVAVPKSAEAQWAQCAGNADAATPDAMIAACSAIIDAGREPPQRMAQVYNSRAHAWHDKAAYQAAIADYDLSLKLAPQHAGALQGRCMSKAVIGQLTQAVADCTQALKLKPNDIASLESRGFAYRKMRAFHRSIADYDAVLKQQPDRASALFGRGVTKLDAGDRDGYADINQAKSVQADVGAAFARYGVYR